MRSISAPERRFVGALVLCALLVVVSSSVRVAYAQEDSPPTLTVSGFEFSGNHAISSSTLAGVVKEAVGRELTLAELYEEVRRVTRFYRDQGLVVAQAFLPDQEVVGGIVRVDVLEGRYGEIRLENTSRLRDDVALDYLASLEGGNLIRESTLERTTLILNDLPGVRAETTFSAGQSVGTSDLAVSLTDDRSPWSANLSINNHTSSDFQSQVGARWNNPRGYGDQLTVRIGPLVSGSRSGSLSYAAPIGGQGLRASLSFATGERSQSVASTPIVTTNRTTGARLEYPIVLTQSANNRIGLDLDARTERRTIGAILADQSRITRTTIDWRSDTSRPNRRSLNYSVAVTQGTLSLAPDNVAAADAASAQTAGSFARVNARMVGRRPLWADMMLNLEMRGQVASKNLHSSEKISIDGVGGVRAYGGGAASGDEGWLVRTDVQRGFRWTAWGLDGTWTVFADIGRVHVNRAPWPGSGGENVVGLAGVGGGVTIARGDWLVEVLNAYPIGSNPVIDGGRSGRLWLRASWQY